MIWDSSSKFDCFYVSFTSTCLIYRWFQSGSILKNNQNTHYSFTFQDRPEFSHIIQKVSSRAFHWCGWTGLSWKITIRTTPLFFKTDLSSAISFKRSRRELFIAVAEHRYTLKNTKIRSTPVLVSYPKQVQHSQWGFWFYCESDGLPTVHEVWRAENMVNRGNG